jgi:hypothetical protein
MMHFQNAKAVHREKYAREDQTKRDRDGTGANSHVFSCLDFEFRVCGRGNSPVFR